MARSVCPSRRTVLVGASAVSTALITGGITAPSAEASDTLPWPGDRAAGTNQPSQRGYTPDQVLAWDPSTDPDAALLRARVPLQERATPASGARRDPALPDDTQSLDRKSTRLNSSHVSISYAVFCLK